MLRTLIIDDEAHIRDTLTLMLARYCHQVSVVGEASGVADGIERINDLQPDLVILDIHMGDGSGLDLLHSLETINFKLIFISSFDKSMIQAFKLSTAEYLVKPVSPVDLTTAVQNATRMKPGDLLMQLKALNANMKTLIQ